MATIDCPRCGAAGDGAFCADCGARLKPAACTACGGAPPADARYCPGCGRRLPGPLRVHPAAVLAGVGLAALFAALLLPGRGPEPVTIGATGAGALTEGGGPGAPGSMSTPGGAPPPALSGDMRANADGLFDRIMRELAAGDTARARFFVPMALDAYGMAGDLDAHGRFHLSLVQAVGEDFAGARATAESVLEQDPNHLLALAAAASAARGDGDEDAARAYYRRFLEALPSERDRALPEYRDHAQVLPDYEAAARAALTD